jgi:hypothetical protein
MKFTAQHNPGDNKPSQNEILKYSLGLLMFCPWLVYMHYARPCSWLPEINGYQIHGYQSVLTQSFF